MQQAVGLPRDCWHSALSGQWLLSWNKSRDITGKSPSSKAGLLQGIIFSTSSMGLFFCKVLCHPTPRPSKYNLTPACKHCEELHKFKTGSGNSFQRRFQGGKETLWKCHAPKQPVLTYCDLPLVCLASFVVEIWGWVKKRHLGSKKTFSSHEYAEWPSYSGILVKGYMSNTPRWWHPRCIHSKNPWHHDWKRIPVGWSNTFPYCV